MTAKVIDLARKLKKSGLDVPHDMRGHVLDAAARLAEAVERLRTALRDAKKADIEQPQ